MENKINKFIYGAEYYPEQWSEEIIYQDIEMMNRAGINTVTLNVFNWSNLEPEEGKFNFKNLDNVISLLEENSIYINFATPTASQPVWAFEKYPDILPEDINGNKYAHGSRTSFCPNNNNYKRLVKNLVTALVNRYYSKKSIIMWHINNEYSCHLQACYCDQCRLEFQNWLKEKYQSIDNLNKIWNSNFWSLKYFEWKDIPVPKKTVAVHNPIVELEYQRFMDDSFLNLYRLERDIIKDKVSGVPVTTNFVGQNKALDFYKWGAEVEFLAWDSYPDPVPESNKMYAPIIHDIMRCSGKGNSFAVMEAAVNQVNWKDINMNKRPGQIRFEAFESIAHGADAYMFFQWRQPFAGPEKFHSAVLNHSGRTDTRVFKEVENLGVEVKKLNPLLNTTFHAEVAFIFDFDSWRSLDYHFQPSNRVNYLDEFSKYYKIFFELNIPVDVISQYSDLTGYKVVVAPILYITQHNFSENIEKFVRNGGMFLTTYFSGISNENDVVYPGVYPGPLKKVLGLEVTEFEPQPENIDITISFKGENKIFNADLWCDTIKVDTAEVKAVFNEDYYEDMPAVTINKYEKGRAVYIGTSPDDIFLSKFLQKEIKKSGVEPFLDLSEGIKVYKRSKITGKEYIIILNYNEKTTKINFGYQKYREIITGEILTRDVKIESKGVMILTSL